MNLKKQTFFLTCVQTRDSSSATYRLDTDKPRSNDQYSERKTGRKHTVNVQSKFSQQDQHGNTVTRHDQNPIILWSRSVCPSSFQAPLFCLKRRRTKVWQQDNRTPDHKNGRGEPTNVSNLAPHSTYIKYVKSSTYVKHVKIAIASAVCRLITLHNIDVIENLERQETSYIPGQVLMVSVKFVIVTGLAHMLQ